MASTNYYHKNGGDFKATAGEIKAVEKALADPEFRRLVAEYAAEISDPENVAVYEAEVAAVERERGFEVTFLHPTPAYVMKTTNLRSDEKVFINVATDAAVDVPSKAPVTTGGSNWSLPYSLSRPRRDVDKGGRPCAVYDVVFHPEALDLGGPALPDSIGHLQRVAALRKRLVTETALDAVQTAFDVKLDTKNVRFPRLAFKGRFYPTFVKKLIEGRVVSNQSLSENTVKNTTNNKNTTSKPQDEVKSEDKKSSAENIGPVPDYSVKYRYPAPTLESTATIPKSSSKSNLPSVSIHRPSEVIIEVHLAGQSSTKGLELDIVSEAFTLKGTDDKGQGYTLKVPFAYPIDESRSTAKFFAETEKLVITAAVNPDSINEKLHEEVRRLCSTDSGIDAGELSSAASSDEDEEQHEAKEVPSTFKTLFPSYNCNIYEDYMIFTLNVSDVTESSLAKISLDGEGPFGFGVTFAKSAGEAKQDYAFYCALVIRNGEDVEFGSNPLDLVDVEVWDNNVILKVSLPVDQDVDCCEYKVGPAPGELKVHELPQLRAFRLKREQLLKQKVEEGRCTRRTRTFSESASEDTRLKMANLKEACKDSDDDSDKARHSSGESVADSVLGEDEEKAKAMAYESFFGAEEEDEVTNASVTSYAADDEGESFIDDRGGARSKVRGILKRSGSVVAPLAAAVSFDSVGSSICGSKKSVRFSEVKQSFCYRPGSSILGQRAKNQKKAQQKRKSKENKLRTLSESDAAEAKEKAETGEVSKSLDDGFKISESEDGKATPGKNAAAGVNYDSGVASSFDEAGEFLKAANVKTAAAAEGPQTNKGKGKKGRKNNNKQKNKFNSQNELIFSMEEVN